MEKMGILFLEALMAVVSVVIIQILLLMVQMEQMLFTLLVEAVGVMYWTLEHQVD